MATREFLSSKGGLWQPMAYVSVKPKENPLAIERVYGTRWPILVPNTKIMDWL